MGNCCGKESRDNFAGPGRTLGSAPAQQPRASLPPKVTSTAAASPGRTVGGRDKTAAGGAAGDDAARSAAARAAEERAKRTDSAPRGKLGQALANERKGTVSDQLQAASAEERRKRDMQAGAEARNWN